MTFDANYYTTNNYGSYLDRGDRYRHLAAELHERLFGITNLVTRSDQILDYGCATGFLVDGFRKVGYQNVTGYDISDWAVNWGIENGITGLTSDPLEMPQKPKLMIALDVFEHMKPEQIEDLFDKIHPEYLLVRIPLAVENGGKFVLNISEQDPTHITRYTREQWKYSLQQYMSTAESLFLRKTPGTHLFDINLSHIYDTPGVMCSLFRCY